MARQSPDPEKIVTSVMVSRVMHNLVTQRGASPSELLDMAMAAYLGIDLEQEVRYESILRMKKNLQNEDMAALRKQHEKIEQQKLDVYNQIEEQNQKRIRIAKCMMQAVQNPESRIRISKDVELRGCDSRYLDDISKALCAALPDILENEIYEHITSTIKNGWKPVLLEAVK